MTVSRRSPMLQPTPRTRFNVFSMLAAVLLTLTGLATAAEIASPGARVIPEQITLHGPRATQQLLLQRAQGEHLTAQVRDDVVWSSADESIASVTADGRVTPVANGTTTIRAQQGNLSSEVQVTVDGMDNEDVISFRHDVLPILTKAGCNQGACHGALAGKGGFRLSLRGYDPDRDFFNIVKQDRGRRVEFADPGRSLILAKPTGSLPHKGGLRLNAESDDYRILAEWIARGAEAPSSEDPEITALSVFPARVELRPDDKQQLTVQAHYSDGTNRDVSKWVKWTSTNDAVCSVNENGLITAVGPGEGAVTAWFSSRIAVARATVPFAETLPKSHSQLAARNFIDEEIDAQLQRLKLPASPLSNDAMFLRRAYLDTIGVLPSAEEVQAFLADPREDKRDRVIDELLERPEFVDYWTYKWSDILMLNGTLLRPKAVKSYYTWIRGHVEKNTPWDQFVREILTATGNTFDEGPTNFYSLYQTPEEMTENASQAFLGLSIACAKCHNHPLEKWTNDQYYAMASLFSRVRSKGWGGEPRNGDGLRTVFVADSGELVQPRTGKPQPPTPLDAEPISFEDPRDRREYLADWLTSAENPYFARSITNRVWANFFGAGLVESVDDMRVSNPASNEELLDRAADFLVAENFNLKSLMREILKSNAYQRDSEPVEGNELDRRFYSRYFPRRLTAEVLHDAIVQVTEVPTVFDSIAFPGADKQKTDFYPKGTRAIELYDSAVESYFLKAFGRNPRNIVCECERSNEPSMVQVLHISNGETINEKLQADGSRVTELMKQLEHGMSLETLVDTAYLNCLSRYPTSEERSRFVAILQETPQSEQRQTVEDLYWALLSSREFIFNH